MEYAITRFRSVTTTATVPANTSVAQPTMAPTAADVGAIIGCLTLLIAATIGLVVTDLKRVIAYSTISQIGYMVMGVSMAAYGAGLFHLMTHGFFKGLLFLGSGSVIHAVHEEQDMNRMGALWRKIAAT